MFKKSRCKDEHEQFIDKDSWSIKVEEFSLDYEENLDKLIFEVHTLP